MKKRGKLGVLFGIFFAFFGVITAIRIAGASGNTFKLKSAEITEKSPQTEAEIINYNDTEVSTRVEFHALDEFVTYKLGLSNSDTKSYKIVKITAESENPYLAYEYNEDFEATVVEGESFDFVLKTIYKTTVESITNRDQNADVVITILYEDESGNVEEEEVIVVPNTNDDTVVPNTGSTEKDGSKAVPIFPFLILLVGVIIAIAFYVKKHKKAAGATLAITLALSIITPLTAISVIDDTITIKNQLGFYNKLNITYPTGSGTANKIINYGEPGGVIPAPGNTPEGYEFDGFEDGDGNDYDPTKPVTSDIDLTPKYKAINYTISYSGLTTEETEFLKNPTSYTIHSSFTLKNPVDRKDSDDDLVQTFVGWSNGEATASAVTIEHQTGNKAYEAIWQDVEPTEYTITYDLDGGTADNRTKFTKYTDTFTLNNPTKTGYIFEGWAGSNGSTPETIVSVAKGTRENLEFAANFNPIHYTITFHGTSGTGEMAPITVAYDETVNLPVNIFDYPGHNFVRWNTKADGSGNTYDQAAEIHNLTTEDGYNLDLYAMWGSITYGITYYLNGGTANNTTTYAPEDSDITLNNPVKTGYTFTGWSGTGLTGDNNLTVVIQSGSYGFREYTAHYSANQYTVRFNKNASTATGTMDDLEMSYDETKNLPMNQFTRPGYTFTNWSTATESYNNGDSIKNLTTEDGAIITLNANWEAGTYTIHYDSNGASGGQVADQTVTFDTPNMLAFNGFTKEGHTFVDWVCGGVHYAGGANFTNLATDKDQTITCVAQWNANTYDINYNNVTSSEVSAAGMPTSYTYSNDEFSFAGGPADRPGYYFNGWTGEGITDPQDSIYIAANATGEKTFTANWEPNTYYIVLHSNDGNDQTESQPMTYGVPANINPNSFIRDGYSFTGWNTNPNGSGTPYSSGANVNNLTTENQGEFNLYAQWATVNYQINYELNGGTAIGNPTSYNAESDPIHLNNPTREGYNFTGWEGSELTGEDNMSVDVEFEPYTNKMFIAHWAPIHFTFIFDGNDGEGSMDNSTFAYDEISGEDVLPANGFTRNGWSFTGWNTQANGQGTAYNPGDSVHNFTTTDNLETTLYAQWGSIPYNILYNLDGGTANNPNTYTIEGTITLNNPTKEGYQFTGWSGTGLEGEDNMTVTIPQGSMGAREYTAHYAELKTYTAYFEDLLYDVTNMPETQTGTSIEDSYEFTNLSIPSRGDRYEFLMWVDKVELEAQHVTHGYMGTTVVVTKPETTFQPIWMDKNLIIYEKNANDAVGTMQDQAYTKCTGTGTEACGTVTLSAPNYSRSGYGFAGWNTEPDGSGTSYGPNEDFPLTKDNKGHIYLYAMWVQSAGNMQSFNCNSLNAGDVTALTDTRDGQTYTVAKLADGQCWMTENLRLDLSQDGDKLTTNNTNNPTAEFLTKSVQKPAAANSSDWCEDDEETEACYNKITYGNENLSATGEDKKRYSYGVLYNGYTATAGNFKYDTAVGEAAGDICPNGWKMPTGGNSGETHAFVNALAGNSAFAYPNNMVLSGMEDGLFIGNESDLWTSTITNDVVVYHGMFYFSITKGYTDDNSIISPNHGHSVRCIAKPTKTYTLTYVVDNEAQNTPAAQTGVTGADSYTFTITNDSPTWDLYWLDGWSTTEGGDVEYRSGDQITVTSDTTLYAVKYEKNLIIYNKNNNGATGTMENQSYTGMGWANYTTLRASNYSLSDYGFVGWNTEANGTGTTYGPNEYIPDVPASGHWNLYAMWIQSTGNLQNFNCNTLASGQVKALTDTRDGQTYAVAKLADGNCWMIENLRFNFATHGDQITTTNTNNPTAEFITKAAQKPSTKETWCDASQDCIDYNTSNITNQGEDNKYSYGVYYNYYAASAGNGGYAVESGNVEGDICPAGWRLPKGKNSGDLANLATNVLGVTAANDRAIRAYPNNIVYSGQVYNNDVGWLGRQSEFWTSSVRFSSAAYDATFGYEDQATYFNGSFAKDDGATVRCMTNN